VVPEHLRVQPVIAAAPGLVKQRLLPSSRLCHTKPHLEPSRSSLSFPNSEVESLLASRSPRCSVGAPPKR
jgi:hypothetical protein